MLAPVVNKPAVTEGRENAGCCSVVALWWLMLMLTGYDLLPLSLT